ncbi:MAG: hypothetical protein D6705_18720 [Deltaproteobacteria bacterium]|nr:MAG: hypothetical protein D6705_18720 [Deltaproteobacteria bacterium]
MLQRKPLSHPSLLLAPIAFAAVTACGGGGVAGGDDGTSAPTGGPETATTTATSGTSGAGTSGETASSGTATSGASTTGATSTGATTGGGPSSPRCEPYPPPRGPTIPIASGDVTALRQAALTAQTGETIVLEPGVYEIPDIGLYFATPGVTLRSSTGNPDDVILDGMDSVLHELIGISASNVAIVELTLRNAYQHLVHIYGEEGSTENVGGTVLYRLILVDPGQQAIKANWNGNMSAFVDDAEVGCSHVELTEAGRQKVPQVNAGECYTGGIDAHGALDWWVHDNTFVGFYCHEGISYASQHAIGMWLGGGEGSSRTTTSSTAPGGSDWGSPATIRTPCPDRGPTILAPNSGSTSATSAGSCATTSS